MSRLTELLRRVEQRDPALAKELHSEVRALEQRRAFGLNFERHTPESVELPERTVRRGDKVRYRAPRGESGKGLDERVWLVSALRGRDDERTASLVDRESGDTAERLTCDLVVIAEFRDPIFPGLRSTGAVEQGGDKPYHTVINGENYHALEALLFAFEGKVDCIYIDPPYNTRDKDWKYNNDYVDSDDAYRHSKWLAMMERRLNLAKRLLNPANSVLIVTIDEKEYLRLGLLLQQKFPEARTRMISTVINPKGVGVSEGFKRVDEYLFILRFGRQSITPSQSPLLGSKPMDGAQRDSEAIDDNDDAPPPRIGLDWQTARRRDLASVRPTRPAQFYPIYVNAESGLIEAIGEAIPHAVNSADAPARDGCVSVFPIRDDGTEMNWGVTAPTFESRWRKGYARAGKATPSKPQPYIIQYLKSGPIQDIEEGRAVVEGKNPDGSVIAFYDDPSAKAPPTQWNLRSHNAEHYGTKVIRSLLPGRNFPFPKSLYGVEDVVRLFVASKPGATILDFFAGSGTTAHAVMRLNRQDGGRRRAILVTNNEVSEDEAKTLRKQGFRDGDPEWEALGICEYITKPRVKAAITGQTPDGTPIKGDYKFTDEFPMTEGFTENAEFFDLTYEDPELVRHDLAFCAIAPLLWLRAGSAGRRIDQPTDTYDVTDTYGVLFYLDAAAGFIEAINAKPGIRVAYIVTDDEKQYQIVVADLPHNVETVRLYESYLNTFQIMGDE